jgi:hypothetical protein
MGKYLEGSVRGLIEALFCHLPRDTEGNHEKPVRIANVPVEIRT